MTTTTRDHLITRKRLAVSFVVVATVINLLGLLGYFWLPGYAKAQVEIILSETLHRPVTIESIDIHLFSMELWVHGFRIGEKTNHVDADEVFFSFEKLYVDLSIESVTHRVPVISAITLLAPTLRLVREDETQFNITDLINEFSQPSDDDDVDKDHETKFSVSNIVIEDGHFELIDQFKQSHQKISDVDLGIPFVANFASKQAAWVEPYFSAEINGSPFVLDGKLRPFTNKREATLELKLNNIDLTYFIEYMPIPTGINLLSGYFDSDLQITFSQVIDESPSITVSGKTALRQFAIKNQAVETPYQITLDNLNIQLNDIDLTGQKTSNAAIALNNMTLIREGDAAPVLSLPEFMINDIQIDMAQQHIVFDEILLDRFNASIRRERDGAIDLTRLFAANSQEASVSETPIRKESVSIPLPKQKPSAAKIRQTSIATQDKESHAAEHVQAAPDETIVDTTSAKESSEQAEEGKQSWTTQIDYFKLTAASFHFEDATLSDVPPMVIDSLDLTLADIDLTGKNPLDLVLQATVNQRGSIDTKGSLSWAPLATDLNIDFKEVDLVALQGWAGDRLTVLLTRGAISFQGKVKADGEPLKVSLTGEGQLSDFNFLNQSGTSDLLRWKNLDINGINFASEPLSIDIESIKLSNYFAHLTITPEGRFNLGNIIKRNEDGSLPSPQPTTTVNTQEEEDKVLPIRIGQIILQHGDVNFNDQFIKPNYRAKLTSLDGEIGPIDPGKLVKVDIRGTVNKSAPLEIAGEFDPFGSEIQLDIKASANDINMSNFSPYSGKHVGYAIEKGKLSVEIHYHIEEGALKAENNIFLDQLTLGEEVDSPDAVSVPLGLAISLLKNRQGEIELHLPVEGSLSDPQFNIGGIVFDAFINLVMKAITAPFSLLSSVLGDGEELSSVDFSAGQANIEAEAEERLQILSQALIDRPSLKLEIVGYTDPVMDIEGLKQVILDRQLKALKLTEDAKKGKASGSLEDVTLEPEEYEKYLTIIYKGEDFEKPENFLGLAKSLPVPEMEQLILTHIEISGDQMQALAQQRANAARNWLVEQGSVDRGRVFVLGTQTEIEAGGQAPGSQAKFSLK